MGGVGGSQAIPGEFRSTQNWIGPPGANLASATPVQIALAHYQFEAIHPFLDGKGRVGRLLVTLFLVEREILPKPILYLSAFFEATRRDYYDRLLGVSERGEWSGWLEYFLTGVARQAEDALRRSARINELLAEWRVAASGFAAKTPITVIDLLAENPYCTIRGVAKRLGVAYTTAQRAIERLESLSIVAQVGKAKRGRVFCARALLQVLEAPATLHPVKAS